ncbi:MAG: hypothetical protein QOI11_1368 [Candidatus Eremiobacteraeota bacterium]|nr:hypothetical protein [Candidatus Eremiobacteraeota bacterium]
MLIVTNAKAAQRFNGLVTTTELNQTPSAQEHDLGRILGVSLRERIAQC